MRLLAPTFTGFVLFVLWAYAIVDVLATEPRRVRRLPKLVWGVVVLAVFGVGAIAWLALGRPRNASWRPGGVRDRVPRRFIGPEDQPDWEPPLRPRPPDRTRRAHPAAGPADAESEETTEMFEAWEAQLADYETELGPDDDATA